MEPTVYNAMNEYWKHYSKLNMPKTVIQILKKYSYMSSLKQKKKTKFWNITIIYTGLVDYWMANV